MPKHLEVVLFHPNIRQLGMSVGYDPDAMATTFQDSGVIRPDSPLRLACSGIEMTLAAFVAGTLRALRNPYLVRVLQVTEQRLGHSPVSQLFEFYRQILAGIYGDNATVSRLRGQVTQANVLRIPAAGQPRWLYDATGSRTSFSLGDEQHLARLLCNLLRPVVEAHFEYVPMRVPQNYMRHLRTVLQAVFGIELGAGNLYDLMQLDQNTYATPLMDARLLERSGAWGLMVELLEIEIGPDAELGHLRDKFALLISPGDRVAYGMSEAVDPAADTWFTTYGQSLERLAYPIPESLRTNASMTEDDLFAVSRRKASA